MTFYRYFHISFAVFDVVSNAFCCISVFFFFLSSSGPASDYFVPFLWTFYSTCCIGSHRKLTPLKLTVCLCYVVLLGVDIFSHGLVVPMEVIIEFVWWTCGAAIIEFVWMSALCTTPDMPTINRLAYSPSFLKSLSNSNYPFQPDVLLQSTLNDIVMCRKRTKTCKRGCRGGMNLIPRILVNT